MGAIRRQPLYQINLGERKNNPLLLRPLRLDQQPTLYNFYRYSSAALKMRNFA